MSSSSDDDLPLAQTATKGYRDKTGKTKRWQPDFEVIKLPRGLQEEKEDVKVDVGAGLNGSGADIKHNDKVKDEPEGDAKPPPETKRKKSHANGAKEKEEARSKKKEPKVEKTKAKAEPNKKSDSAKVTKPKMQYDMPGQTQPTPNKGEPLVRFYTSLREQRPNSEIANKWCVQRGLVSREEAEAWLKKNGKASAAKDSGRSPSKPRAPAARKPAAKKSTDKAKKEARKPAKKPPASSKKAKKPRDVACDFDESDSSSAEEEEDDDEYDEVLPKSKRVSNKSTGRASAGANGSAKEHKKRKRKESESEGDASEDESDEPLEFRQNRDNSKKRVARASPGGGSKGNCTGSNQATPGAGSPMATGADEDSSEDELPLAQRREKVAA